MVEGWYYSGMNTAKSFFYHYNKPASIKHNKVTISLHYLGTCYLVNSIVCNVPCRSKINKRQPRFVMQGKANNISIINGAAVVD